MKHRVLGRTGNDIVLHLLLQVTDVSEQQLKHTEGWTALHVGGSWEQNDQTIRMDVTQERRTLHNAELHRFLSEYKHNSLPLHQHTLLNYLISTLCTSYSNFPLQSWIFYNDDNSWHSSSKTRKFNTANAKARHWTRSSASSIHLQSSENIPLRTFYNYFPASFSTFQEAVLKQVSPPKFRVYSLSSHPSRMPSPSWPPVFHSPNNTRTCTNHEIPRQVIS
jgi:hypothetical protein